MADTNTSDKSQAAGWWTFVSGADFQRALGMAFGPGKIFLVLFALAACFLWGLILNWVAVKVDQGITSDGVSRAVGVLFTVLFYGVSLLVWAWLGGAVCRMNAVEFARGERLECRTALAFARQHLWSGFFLAPLMPLIFVVLLALILCIGGMVMSIPWLGDIVCGLLFVLAIGLGLLAALAIVTTVAGFSFYWPAVATTGCDAMDGVLNTSAYLRSRLARSIWYLLVIVVLVCVTWIVATAFIWLGLWVTNVSVEAGTDLWTSREAVSEQAFVGEGSKLNAVWVIGAPWWNLFGAIEHMPTTGDRISWFLVRIWVLLAGGLSWAAAVSVWFACSTAGYFLLRREVDNVELTSVDPAGLEADDAGGEPEKAPGEAPTETPAPAESNEG